MEYEVGKAFELITEKLDLILAKLYPEEVKKQEQAEQKAAAGGK